MFCLLQACMFLVLVMVFNHVLVRILLHGFAVDTAKVVCEFSWPIALLSVFGEWPGRVRELRM